MTVLKTISALALTLALAVGLVACGSSIAPTTSSDPSDVGGRSGDFRILVFSRTTSFRHASIEKGVETIRQLGADNGFDVDHTEDPTAFTLDNLSRYSAVLWLSTTGDVLDAPQQTAFENFITRGGGYIGVHSASDSEYEWPFYGQLVGAYFKNHPVFPFTNAEGPGVQEADFQVEAPDHPATAHLPIPWRISDEFYSFRTNPRGIVRVLMNIDESTYDQDPNTSNIQGDSAPIGETGVMNDHPMSWCHDRLGGRAWYTALGHSVSIYDDANFQQHLLNGILTAARRVAADCIPKESGPRAEPNQDPSVPQQVPGLAELVQLLQGAAPTP